MPTTPGPHDEDRPPTHPDDLRLAQATLAGRAEALQAFVERMSCIPAMLRIQNRRLAGPLASEDLHEVAQEALTALWTKLGDYQGRAALETWAWRFALLELLKGVDRRRRHERQQSRDTGALPAPAPEEREVRGHEAREVHAGLDALNGAQADVIRLRHFEGLTFDEIATRLGAPITTVKARYYRGLTRLREHLERRRRRIGR